MKRKEFIFNTGGLILSSLTATNLFANVHPSNNLNSQINVGVVGTGARGKGLIKLLNDINGYRIIGACDNIPFRLEEGFSLIPKSKIARAYGDYRKLLDDNNIDAIIVSTPFYTHDQISIDALDAGKHVYCEKTMTKGISSTRNLVKKCKQSDKIFQTGHQFHSSRMYSQLVDLINDGKVGNIISIEAQWNRNGDWRRVVKNPSQERQINWRMYREYSYGLLAELSAHQIDFVNWFLDDTPKKAIGFGGIDYWKDGRETYDNTKVVYEYSNGLKATFTSLTANAKDGYKIMVMGDKGTLTIYQDSAWFYPEGEYTPKYGDVDGVSGATTNWSQSKGLPLDLIESDSDRATLQALIDFRNSILNNKRPLSNIITGANVSYAVEMGIQAMDTNKVIEWNNDQFIL